MVVAIYGKGIENDFFPYLKHLIACLQAKGVEILCEEGFARLLAEKSNFVFKFARTFGKEGLRKEEVSLLLSIGGDGTFLDSVIYVKDSGVPVLGVNSGRLGFLANVPANEIEEAVDCLVLGHYRIEQRDMLELQINRERKAGFDYALNEVGVLKVATSSLLKIHAYIAEVYLTTYWADGLIVATPTGSTAYSLSGGGPIVCPDCRNIILTPVCPHNLSMRPLVVPNSAEILLEVESRSGDFVLSMDSRVQKMTDKSHLFIRSGETKINVVTLPGHNYYETLRNKLMWGEDRRNGLHRFE
ncbi:MAG: NAD kinase [Odoribacter sp.]